MAKSEWGIKRTCQSCDAFFYDLKKDPIVCPKCMTVYDEKALIQKHSESLNHVEEKEIEMLDEEDIDGEDEFFLDTPSDLLESLEDLEDDLEAKHVISG